MREFWMDRSRDHCWGLFWIGIILGGITSELTQEAWACSSKLTAKLCCQAFVMCRLRSECCMLRSGVRRSPLQVSIQTPFYQYRHQAHMKSCFCVFMESALRAEPQRKNRLINKCETHPMWKIASFFWSLLSSAICLLLFLSAWWNNSEHSCLFVVQLFIVISGRDELEWDYFLRFLHLFKDILCLCA
jgi:hypothetical protein